MFLWLVGLLRYLSVRAVDCREGRLWRFGRLLYERAALAFACKRKLYVPKLCVRSAFRRRAAMFGALRRFLVAGGISVKARVQRASDPSAFSPGGPRRFGSLRCVEYRLRT